MNGLKFNIPSKKQSNSSSPTCTPIELNTLVSQLKTTVESIKTTNANDTIPIQITKLSGAIDELSPLVENMQTKYNNICSANESIGNISDIKNNVVNLQNELTIANAFLTKLSPSENTQPSTTPEQPPSTGMMAKILSSVKSTVSNVAKPFSSGSSSIDELDGYTNNIIKYYNDSADSINLNKPDSNLPKIDYTKYVLTPPVGGKKSRKSHKRNARKTKKRNQKHNKKSNKSRK
jgi:hypothetical protein